MLAVLVVQFNIRRQTVVTLHRHHYGKGWFPSSFWMERARLFRSAIFHMAKRADNLERSKLCKSDSAADKAWG